MDRDHSLGLLGRSICIVRKERHLLRQFEIRLV